MKVLFVSRLFHNVSGGVERMAIALMNELCVRRHRVELLSWDRAGAATWYPLDDSIVWHCLDMGDAQKKAGWGLRIRRQVAIRRLLTRSRPDLVIAFQDGPFLAVAMAALGLGIPLIAAERNAPQRYDYLQAGKRRNLIFQTLRLADCITVQLEDYVPVYPRYLQDRITSIPNPVNLVGEHARPAGHTGDVKRLLSVGRLSYQKNQRILIEAFSRLCDAVPDWQLVFVGGGEDELKLRKLSIDSGLGSRIVFVGPVKDVKPWYLSSHLFCLPSRWEGFPNAMAEAMAHGLPVVGYADCAGVKQLVVDGQTGCLAPGNGLVDTLATTLLQLMCDDNKRERMGGAAAAAMEQFAPTAIFDRWEALFHKVARRA